MARQYQMSVTRLIEGTLVAHYKAGGAIPSRTVLCEVDHVPSQYLEIQYRIFHVCILHVSGRKRIERLHV
jgi:hypothetical protein